MEPLIVNPRLLNEICKEGKLELYRETLSNILNLIHSNGCRVSARYDVTYSNYTDYLEGRHIRISLLNVKEPLDVIWKLLHEYGHFLSPKRKQEDTDMERELMAWGFADQLLPQYSDLYAHKDAYELCKECCLESYRKYGT